MGQMRPRILLVDIERPSGFRLRLRQESCHIARPIGAPQEHPGEQPAGLAVARADCDRPPTEGFGLVVSGQRALGDACQRPDYTLPGIEALRRLALAAEMLGRIELRLDRPDHPFGNLICTAKMSASSRS